MTNIGTFLRFAIKSIYRRKGRAFSSLVGVLIAVTLLAGENIAIDTMARDKLEDELRDVEVDFYGYEEDLSSSDALNLTHDLEAIKGVDRVTPVTTLTTTLEVHNASTVNYAKYGYYGEDLELNVGKNETLWYNVTLQQIPRDLRRVSGHVYYLSNGTPIGDVTVQVLEGGTGSGHVVNIDTDSMGYYEMELPKSDFLIRFYYEELIFNTTWWNLTYSHSDVVEDFYLPVKPENSSIEGYLIDSLTGKPLNGYGEIRVMDPSINYVREAGTNLSGYYHINVTAGNFVILTWAYVYDNIIYRFLRNISSISIPGNTPLQINQTLFDSVLKGYVYDNLTGEPIDNAKITVASNIYSFVEETWVDGSFTATISPGKIETTISKMGYITSITLLEVLSPTRFSHDFYLERSSSVIQGFVYNYNGDPLENAVIEMNDQDYNTDKNGFYSFQLDYNDLSINYDAFPENEIRDHDKLSSRIMGLYQEQSPNLNDFIEEHWSFELLEGTAALGNMQILIPKRIAERYNLKVGDVIRLIIDEVYWDSKQNEFKKENMANLTVSGIFDDRYLEEELISTYFFVDIQDLHNIYKVLNDFPPDAEFDHDSISFAFATEILLFIDRDKIINPFNQEASILSLRRLDTKINRISIFNYNVRMDSRLDVSIKNYFEWFEGHRVEMFAYSLPVIGLGLYLGIIGIDISTAQKRRELGILKSRGANNNQILLLLIVEAIFLGFIAGIMGLFLGIFVSKLFVASSSTSNGILNAFNIFQTEVTVDSIILTLFLAISLMMIASLKPARKISKAPLIETLHHYSKPLSGKEYSNRFDIFVVIFSILAYLAIVFISPIIYEIEVTAMVFIFLFLLLIISIYIWFPISPFLMTFSLTRLLTRGTNKLYRFFSLALRRFTGELWYIIERNIVRNPRRVSNVCIIIALTVGFSVLITTMSATTMHGEEIRIQSEIGGDLALKVYSTNVNIEEDLKVIEGVEHVVTVSWLKAEITNPSWIGNIAIFNASSYNNMIDVGGYYFIEGAADEAFTLIATGDYAIIGDELARDNFLGKGDIFQVTLRRPGYYPITTEETKNFIVAGVVRTLPGLQSSDSLDYSGSWGNDIFCDTNAFQISEQHDRDWRYLVNIESAYNQETVEISIWDYLSSSTYSFGEIRNLDRELEELDNSFYDNPLIFSMSIDIVFMVIIITIGLGLIMSISTSERKNEIATIMARGASRRQITALLLGEAISIMLVGVLIGTIVGLLTAYTFNQMLVILEFSASVIPGRPFVISTLTFFVIGLCILSLLIAALLTVLKASKIKLHQELRIRGG